jgi:hypothetical protein
MNEALARELGVLSSCSQPFFFGRVGAHAWASPMPSDAEVFGEELKCMETEHTTAHAANAMSDVCHCKRVRFLLRIGGYTAANVSDLCLGSGATLLAESPIDRLNLKFLFSGARRRVEGHKV